MRDRVSATRNEQEKRELEDLVNLSTLKRFVSNAMKFVNKNRLVFVEVYKDRGRTSAEMMTVSLDGEKCYMVRLISEREYLLVKKAGFLKTLRTEETPERLRSIHDLNVETILSWLKLHPVERGV